MKQSKYMHRKESLEKYRWLDGWTLHLNVLQSEKESVNGLPDKFGVLWSHD